MSMDDNTPSAGDNSPVQDFYRDCGVLVTGGTRFLGKLVIEKILRCCPAVRTVYVLIRPKKGVSAEDRRKALMDNEVFERMKSEQPDWQSRLVFVSGDCSQPRLGLSDTDYHHLTQHVNIVLHLAATVRFDETLKVAIAINVKGTEEVIRLCRDCVHLKAAVYVSTAYSNCIHQLIKEEFYEPPMSLDDLFALMDSFTEQELHMLFPKVKCRWPNTYAFSKAMAENLILTQAKDLPVSVVRPSMGDNSPVQDFYRDCGVLVTGGTGFLGKLVIEKILRCCPAARTVYVLIRPKKGVSAEDRREALMDNEVFERMKSEQPDWQSRLVFVSGDCSQPRLGLSDTDYHHLTQHVNIVLHLAATVRFDETLKVAIAINVKGTEDIIRLCRDCVRLKAAVFVSTAYSNCIHQLIKEEFYEPPMSLDDLFALMDSFTEQELHMLLPKVKCRWPNTYAFSKAMAENLILTQAKDLPVSVVRPSMGKIILFLSTTLQHQRTTHLQ
ncbi:fatty acyl-CoA reductase wat-like isoform X3 [Bacillus rossius redtenbacheri]|uniref:fatty acyl-CoA reductase wat-like isoform X3 n=1 Tax=Bacillus rossius redtenbacheri TaxID=93214 RepID=UPI002FDD93CF